MGRPRKGADAKSEVINIRVTPALKAKLEAHARIAGRPLSPECEARLHKSMIDTEARASQDTEELLTEIKRLIAAIEQPTGRGWRESVGTWAAVAEMLATGPIMQRVPPNLTENDKRLEQRWSDVLAAKEERSRLASLIALMGIVSVQLAPTLHMIMPDREDLRQKVRERLPDHLQENAEALIDKLEELDERQRRLVEEIDDIVEPYREAIESGRSRYEQPPKGAVLFAALSRLDRTAQASAEVAPPSTVINALLRPMPHGRPVELGGAYARPTEES